MGQTDLDLIHCTKNKDGIRQTKSIVSRETMLFYFIGITFIRRFVGTISDSMT